MHHKSEVLVLVDYGADVSKQAWSLGLMRFTIVSGINNRSYSIMMLGCMSEKSGVYSFICPFFLLYCYSVDLYEPEYPTLWRLTLEQCNKTYFFEV